MTMSPRRLLAACALLFSAMPASAQSASPPPRPDGRVSFYVTTDRRRVEGDETNTGFEFASAFTFRTPDADSAGLDAGVDLRVTRYGAIERPQRLSLYDGYAGARLGSRGQFRVRAGHLWLPDLGTAGALAGGAFEYRSAPSGADRRWLAGAFAGAEPLGYESGYAPDVRKYGGYAALESGYLRRHVVGFANITQAGVTQRSMLTVANYIPAGDKFFAYQALEYDLKGPANGAASSGLSYFLINARAAAGPRVELQGTYNRGRSIDARGLTDDVLSGRPLSPQAVEGLRYETIGGRASLTVSRGIEIYGGYARDRNNRDDQPTGRLTIGGYAGNLFNSGFDISGSDARVDRPTGPYHSLSFSAGHSLGRSVYLSGDFTSSLAVVRFERSDGVRIETRPRTRRISGNGSATLNRQFSLVGVVDYTMDEGMNELRVMTGITYRMR